MSFPSGADIYSTCFSTSQSFTILFVLSFLTPHGLFCSYQYRCSALNDIHTRADLKETMTQGRIDCTTVPVDVRQDDNSNVLKE